MPIPITINSSPLQNDLLATLSFNAQKHLFPHLQRVPLELGFVLYDSGERLKYAYFPVNAIVSLVYDTQEGASAEIAMVGRDGVVGVAAFLGGESSLGRAVVLSAGFAYRLNVKILMNEDNRHDQLLCLLLRYVQALLTQTAQTAVCNRHHTIEKQLCRWLLQSLDRLPDNQINITQESIANMLGVRREGVTEAAGRLQKIGAITYHRGHITVLDRKILERLSCECYSRVNEEMIRLFPQRFKREKFIRARVASF